MQAETEQYVWPTLGLVAASAAGWFAAHSAVSYASPRLCPDLVSRLSEARRAGWLIRVVSLFHAILSCSLVLIALSDPTRPTTAYGRMFGRFPAANVAQVVSAGFFLWDSIICLVHYKTFGPAFLFHGVACFLSYTFSCVTTVIQYYGAIFLLFELSTLFLNCHWLMDKAGYGKHWLLPVNDAAGVLVYVSVRLVFGNLATWWHFQDAAEVWGQSGLPQRLAVAFLLTVNVALDVLNVFWFYGLARSVLRGAKAKGAPKTPKELQ